MKNRTFAILLAGGLASGTCSFAAGFSYSFNTSGQNTTGTILTPAGSKKISVNGHFTASVLVHADAANPSPADFTVTYNSVTLTLENVGSSLLRTWFVNPASPWTIQLGTLGTVTAVASNVAPDGTASANFNIPVGVFSVLGTLRTQGTYKITATWGSSPNLSVSAGKNGNIAGITGPVFTGTVTIVPEPAEVGLIAGLGLLGFGLWRSRRA